MTSSSESRLAAMGRAAPVDAAAAVVSGFLGAAALVRPELFEGVRPEQATACVLGLFSFAAMFRTWVRSRRRIRASRRAARG